MRRPARALAVCVPLALTLAACGGVGGGGDEPRGTTGGDGGERPTVTTMGFGLPDAVASTRVELAEEANDVEVDVVEGGFDEQQFLSAVASGNPPDLVYLSRNTIGTYAARGAIQPLDECVESAGIDMDAFREAAVEQVTIDGTVYGIPEFTSVRVVIADTQVMEDAGVTLDQVSSGDWDQIRAANAAMARAEGGTVSRIGFDPKLPEFLPLWARANGADLLSEDGLTANLDDPAVVEAVEFGASLVQEAGGWSAFQAFRDSWDFFGAQNQYASDQLGAMPMEEWYVNVLADVSPDAGAVVAPFRDRQGEPLAYSTGNAWAVPADAADPEAACEVARTMTETETWVAAATARAREVRGEGGFYTGTWTGNAEADEEIFADVFEPTGNEALDTAVETLLETQEVAFALPSSPAAAQVQTAYEDAVVRVLQGDQDAAAAMAQAQQEAQRALDEAVGD